MHVGHYLRFVQGSEAALADALRRVAEQHGDEPDIVTVCLMLAAWSDDHGSRLGPIVERYQDGGDGDEHEPRNLEGIAFGGPREGPLALLRDLHDLALIATEAAISWSVLAQAAKALRDRELDELCAEATADNDRQLAWIQNRVKQAAPQALVVAE